MLIDDHLLNLYDCQALMGTGVWRAAPGNSNFILMNIKLSSARRRLVV